MQKSGQKRGPISRFLETVNYPAAQLEGFFKPELNRIMNDLRKSDDNIRAILSGQKVDSSDVETDGRGVKEILKSARKNFNRRQYISGVSELGLFHKKMYDVSQYIKKLKLSVEKIHHKFLFQGVKDTDKWKNVEELQRHMSSSAEEIMEDYFIKEADIMDFFYNIGTKPGRSMAAWEKKYPKVAKDLREGGLRLLDQADDLMATVFSHLKEMASARATRQVDDYMTAVRQIEAAYAKFDAGDKGFRSYYSNVVKPYLDRQAEYDAEEAAQAKAEQEAAAKKIEEEKAKALQSKQPSGQLSLFQPSMLQQRPAAPPASVPPPADTLRDLPSGVSPGTPDEPARVRVAPTPGTEEPAQKVRVGHQQFMKSLEAMGDEDPRIVASFISKYATKIQENDPETAITLFTIVKRLRG